MSEPNRSVSGPSRAAQQRRPRIVHGRANVDPRAAERAVADRTLRLRIASGGARRLDVVADTARHEVTATVEGLTVEGEAPGTSSACRPVGLGLHV